MFTKSTCYCTESVSWELESKMNTIFVSECLVLSFVCLECQFINSKSCMSADLKEFVIFWFYIIWYPHQHGRIWSGRVQKVHQMAWIWLYRDLHGDVHLPPCSGRLCPRCVYHCIKHQLRLSCMDLGV